MVFSNAYQQTNDCYIRKCTYSFDLKGDFIIQVNEIIVDLSMEGLSNHQRIMLWPQPAQSALQMRLGQQQASNWILITAQNPRGKTLNAMENEERHLKLLQRMNTLGNIYQECHSGDFGGDPGHLEKGVVCFEIDEEQALALAREFDQNAWIGGDLRGQVCLYWVPEARADLAKALAE
jgi:hypothetical protein